MSLDQQLQNIWYGKSGFAWLLAPLSWLFGSIAAIRRGLFRYGVLPSVKLQQPVIVVGNLTVGGTGKTPLVIWLANRLSDRGQRVAVITRGYGGKSASWPQMVQGASDPALVGDESVLIAQQTRARVIAGPDRVVSAQQAIAQGAEIVISDDGLQHYRLQRDGELIVVDASRMFGNGRLLPAGPLREPVSRLQQADLLLLNQRSASEVVALPEMRIPMVSYRLDLTQLRALSSGAILPLADFYGKSVHVVTAIGHPQAFVAALEQAGMQVDARLLRDHAILTQADLEFGDDWPVLMTGKDAVKCRRFAAAHHWVVEAQVAMSDAAAAQVMQCVDDILKRAQAQH
jgi:tetraacyldisaccharide 4'-kinase